MFLGHRLGTFQYKDTEHRTVIFNAFVFLQIFNEINSRKVCGGASRRPTARANDECACGSAEWNVFERFFDNAMFPSILAITVAVQVCAAAADGPPASAHAPGPRVARSS
jgi:Ca2+ transporting ATPase